MFEFQKCQQYVTNSFDLSACLIESNLDECVKKHAAPNEFQSKQVEEILARYIDTSESRLAAAIAQAESTLSAETATTSMLTSQTSTDFLNDIDLLSFDFSVDTVDAGAVPSQSNLGIDNQTFDHTFDLITDPDASQLDRVLNNFDQTMVASSTASPAPVSFRTLLEESTATAATTSTILAELKPVNSSDLASQMADDVLNEQFLSVDEILVSHSKRDSSSITIKAKKKPAQAVTIVDDVAKDELMSYLEANSPNKTKSAVQSTKPTTTPQLSILRAISKSKQTQSTDKNSTTLLPWEIKNKVPKSKSRFVYSEKFR